MSRALQTRDPVSLLIWPVLILARISIVARIERSEGPGFRFRSTRATDLAGLVSAIQFLPTLRRGDSAPVGVRPRAVRKTFNSDQG